MNVVDLQVEVEGDCIIVSMPGTSFRATYLKSQDPRDQRQLVEFSRCQLTKKRLSPAKSLKQRLGRPRRPRRASWAGFGRRSLGH